MKTCKPNKLPIFNKPRITAEPLTLKQNIKKKITKILTLPFLFSNFISMPGYKADTNFTGNLPLWNEGKSSYSSYFPLMQLKEEEWKGSSALYNNANSNSFLNSNFYMAEAEKAKSVPFGPTETSSTRPLDCALQTEVTSAPSIVEKVKCAVWPYFIALNSTAAEKLEEQQQQQQLLLATALLKNSNKEFKKTFQNLIDTKSTIIGKIRSIKLIEFIDKMKENKIKAEIEAAKVRLADITELNIDNKKKYRKVNRSRYIVKKAVNIYNRLKILHLIEVIKTDFNFEAKIDSISQSIIPVPVLYYSNLKNISVPFASSSTLAVAVNNKRRIRTEAEENFTLGISLLKKNKNKHENKNKYKLEEELELEEQPPVLSAFLRELSIYNRETKGTINYFSKIVGFNFNEDNNKIFGPVAIYIFLAAAFKAMNCLISKPIFVITPDKITVQLFYFLLIPSKKHFISERKSLYKKTARGRSKKKYSFLTASIRNKQGAAFYSPNSPKEIMRY
jgi:hypothetical protein